MHTLVWALLLEGFTISQRHFENLPALALPVPSEEVASQLCSRLDYVKATPSRFCALVPSLACDDHIWWQVLALQLVYAPPFLHMHGSFGFLLPQCFEMLNADLKQTGSDVLVNLASNEYFSSVNKKALNAQLITPVFKDEKNGQFKVISFY